VYVNIGIHVIAAENPSIVPRFDAAGSLEHSQLLFELAMQVVVSMGIGGYKASHA
jgi:hypothetical protein